MITNYHASLMRILGYRGKKVLDGHKDKYIIHFQIVLLKMHTIA